MEILWNFLDLYLCDIMNFTMPMGQKYRKTYNIRCTLLGYKIVDHSDVFGASPAGAAPTTSSFST